MQSSDGPTRSPRQLQGFCSFISIPQGFSAVVFQGGMVQGDYSSAGIVPCCVHAAMYKSCPALAVYVVVNSLKA